MSDESRELLWSREDSDVSNFPDEGDPRSHFSEEERLGRTRLGPPLS